MKLRITPSLIVFAAIGVPAICQVRLISYQGDGYSVSYPASWKRQVTGTAVALITPESENQIAFKIFASGEKTQQAFFRNYRAYAAGGALGFQATFESGTQPMVYGAWRGDTIDGQGQANGVEVVVSATAIEANNQFYLLQLVAPLSRSWEAHEYLAALGRSLTFKYLPKRSTGPGGGGGAGCANCLSIWTQTMDRITATTVNGMR